MSSIYRGPYEPSKTAVKAGVTFGWTALATFLVAIVPRLLEDPSSFTLMPNEAEFVTAMFVAAVGAGARAYDNWRKNRDN